MSIFYKTFQSLRTVFHMLLCGVFLLSAAPLAAQDTATFYTVQNINVDVSAANALKAREMAFEQAQVKAFEELAGRLLEESAFANFKAPSAQTISMLIQDYEVIGEKIASKRYSGSYIFRFRRNAVDKQLGIYASPPAQMAQQNFGSETAGINPNAPSSDNLPSAQLPNQQLQFQGGLVPSAPSAPSSSQGPVDQSPYPQQAQTGYAYGVQAPAQDTVSVSAQRYLVHAGFSSLSEWAGIQRALARVYGLSDVVLKALSPREAYIELVFAGDLARLQMALAQADLILDQPRVQNVAGGSGAYELSLNKDINNGANANSPARAQYQGRF